MKNFITILKDIWKIEELKNKILLTLGLIAVYRFMAGVPLPGIDPLQLSALKESTSSGLLGLLNAFTGGAFSRASIMALGIMPYITLSLCHVSFLLMRWVIPQGERVDRWVLQSPLHQFLIICCYLLHLKRWFERVWRLFIIIRIE